MKANLYKKKSRITGISLGAKDFSDHKHQDGEDKGARSLILSEEFLPLLEGAIVKVRSQGVNQESDETENKERSDVLILPSPSRGSAAFQQ